MINIEKGRYWDLPWSLVSGCTPCSPGCDNCWSLAMEKRFSPKVNEGDGCVYRDTSIHAHPERLDIPLKRQKPTVFAVWNDFWHESVPDDFQYKAYDAMVERHTFLILTKRPHIAADYYAEGKHDELLPRENIYHGLTVCNQQEAYEKLSYFRRIPGNKFLSLEPLLSDIPFLMLDGIDCVICGGETGPGARPMHPDWVRSVRDQCAAAGVPFFFKQWGEWIHCGVVEDETKFKCTEIDGTIMCRVGKKASGRRLDGQTHDDLPWFKGEKS
jgi:protein gp37